MTSGTIAGMANYGTRSASRQGKPSIAVPLKPKDLPPEGPANRRQRRAAAKQKKATELPESQPAELGHEIRSTEG